MVKGRKPKSSSLKAVSGNPGKRPINNDEPRYDALDLSTPPEELTGLARSIWEEYEPNLTATKVLTGIDRHNLYGFCVNYAHWYEANEQLEATKHELVPILDDSGKPKLNDDGTSVLKERGYIAYTVFTEQGGSKPNPLVKVMEVYQRLYERLGETMGLNPSSRSRLSIPGTSHRDNPFSKLPGRSQQK